MIPDDIKQKILSIAKVPLQELAGWIWLFMRGIVNVYYRQLPRKIGGWEGASNADICFYLTNVPTSHWMLMLEGNFQQCSTQIEKTIDSLTVASLPLVFIFSSHLIFGLIDRFNAWKKASADKLNAEANAKTARLLAEATANALLGKPKAINALTSSPAPATIKRKEKAETNDREKALANILRTIMDYQPSESETGLINRLLTALKPQTHLITPLIMGQQIRLSKKKTHYFCFPK